MPVSAPMLVQPQDRVTYLRVLFAWRRRASAMPVSSPMRGPKPNNALDEVFCDQGDQITLKFDFQSPPGMPRWLSWYRKKGSGTSVQVYRGVYYKCFDTRRSYFPTYNDKALNNASMDNTRLDEGFGRGGAGIAAERTGDT